MDLDVDLDLDEVGNPRRVAVALDAAAYRSVSEDSRRALAMRLREVPAITVALGGREPLPPGISDSVDVILTSCADEPEGILTDTPDVEFAALEKAVEASAGAALTLAWLLRAGDWLGVLDALVAESTAYSMLLAGPDFAAWLRRRGPGRPSDDVSRRIDIERVGDVLRIVLARPHRRNAVDAAMRDALCEALRLAVHDPRLLVEISAQGPAFSAGGDLNEFGSAPDPVAAHLIRVTAGVAHLLHELRDRVTVRVQGTCVGAGIELPAFAGRVVAEADASFGLPEIAMGLIPGAGGTVSIPRRIGRQRALWLALTGARIDATTALEWGLVDAID